MKMLLLVQLHIISIVLLWGINSRAAASTDYELAPPPIAKPNCTANCGGVSIPYPFGIGPNSDCYFDDWFQIDCHDSTTPILRRSKLEVLSLNVSYDFTLRVNNPVTFFNCKGKEIRQAANLTGSPFVYSQEKNKFVAVSCGFFASVSSDPENLVGGCKSICGNPDLYYDNSCDIGINCCQATIPPYLTVINSSIQAHAGKSRMTDCDDYAFLVEQEWFENNVTNDFMAVKEMDSVPVVLDWSLSLEHNKSLFKLFEGFSAEQVQKPNDPTPLCSINNATAETYNNRSTVKCSCPSGFEGNPFLLQPCQDIDECKVFDPCIISYSSFSGIMRNISNALCKNTLGGHTCYNLKGATCELWANGNTKCSDVTSEAIPRSNKMIHLFSGLASGIPLSFGLGFGLGLGVLLLLIGVWWAQKAVKKRKNIKCRAMFFKRNGGLLLEQHISSGKVNIEKVKLFNSNELEKSTDNFNIDRVLGQGGQGTVFKGMLEDGNIVAVKKSKIDHKGKVSEFINEVIILSQINHRNIVQLLGCCLETEVPLLVYEFIPNGTLSQYIYEQNEVSFPLTWQMRLQIATEIAGALSYLHAAASCPIYHRDIKSTNILLDEKYRAKIADFGISRTVSIDQTHLTTNVHGTFGYMDPEYFQSSQFTEKSDVYSFGVVLVELLTGQKPISAVTRSTEGEEEKEEEEYRSLATYFIVSMQEDRLFNILDARVVNEGSKEDIMIVADLARRSLNLNGRNRPTMREVTAELEAIQMSNRTHQGAELILEAHYPIDLCDDVVSSSTGSTWDSGPASSLLELPQSSM